MSTSRSVSITVPRIPPSGNELRRKYRHWAAYRKLKLAWAQDMRALVTLEEHAFLFLFGTVRAEKMRVEFEIHRPKMLDEDNCMAGLKPILDAMQVHCGNVGGLGWIYRDSMDYLELAKPVQVKCKRKDAHTVITVRRADRSGDGMS